MRMRTLVFHTVQRDSEAVVVVVVAAAVVVLIVA
jgi:hypothetical protein